MSCERNERFRRNTIAFWVSDEEKAEVEARIILSGLPKGTYYRDAILGKEINVVAGNYMSQRVAIVLEQIYEKIHSGDLGDLPLLEQLLVQILEMSSNKNAPVNNKDISE